MARITLSRRGVGIATAVLLPLGLIVVPLAALGTSTDPPPEADDAIIPHEPEFPEIVTITLPDRDSLDALVATGVDLSEDVEETDAGLEVDAIVTPSEQDWLDSLGFTIAETVATEKELVALQEERQEMIAEQEAAQALAALDADELRVQRAMWFQNYSGTYVVIEVWSSDGTTPASASPTLTVELDAGPGTEIGDGPTFNLGVFIDAGYYLYHRTANQPTAGNLNPQQGTPRAVDVAPSRMRVTSSEGGVIEADFTEYLDGTYPGGPGGPKDWGSLQTNFLTHYIDATEGRNKIEELAAEFPNIAEIIDLPHKTNGYRRKAQHLTTGVQTSQAVNVTSHAWGHEGGNDITIAYVNPGAPDSPLDVTVDSTDITVSLATNSGGALSSTAAQIVAAINNDPEASQLVLAHTYRGNAGAGITPAFARVNLSDFLTAPEYVSREPFEMKAIRIGKHRDGSKVGVFLYSQEHAREWVTPLLADENAERLLRNYESNDFIRKLVDNLDIFIIPSVNPDGTHYSIHDRTLQRRNMTNYCPITGAADANGRGSWGVDLNRNFRVGNLEQGFTGSSTSCTSDTFRGPGTLSEPEAKNEIWLVENNPNIRFAMNTHTHGGYFMWAPGAYRAGTRDGLERPSYGVESFFYEASDIILNRIKEHRGTVVPPSRVGPISDVLYSAAGNSADDHFYSNDVFAWSFEAGAQVWNPAQNRWVDVGFTPPYAEGEQEALEFSNGWLGILEVAYKYAKDSVLPKATLDPAQGTYSSPVDVTFNLSEPADVYYTLDGSRPTLESSRIEFSGPRQSQQPITIGETTTIKWFAIDAAGNVQGNYSPSGGGSNYQQATIKINQ